MEMHQVRYFLSMARHLNFTRAAEECDVTQPSLTRAIQKLEEELGGPLFRRERSKTHLTELGRLMLPHLERTYEGAETAKTLARNAAKAAVAPLSLGVAAVIDSDVLDEVLVELARGLPGLELKLVTGSSDELLERAAAGTLDLLIVEAPEEAPERIEAWALYSHEYHLLAAADHALARTGEARLGDARDEAWVEFGSDNRRLLVNAARQSGFDPDIRHSASERSQIDRIVGAGLGVALLPRPRGQSRLAALRLVDVELHQAVVLAAIAGRKRSVASDAFVRAARARGWNAAASA